MAKFLAYAVLVCFLAFQVDGSRDKRAITLPTINIFDPASSLATFLNFTKSIGSEVTNLAGQALSVADQLKTDLDNVVKEVVNKTKTDVQKLVQGVTATIQDRLANGPVGNAIKAAKCGAQGVGNATAAGEAVVSATVSCITNEVSAFLMPVGDLLDKGRRALFLGSNIFQNVSSCFPHGFNVNPFELLGDIGCVIGKVGPALAEVSTILTSIANDIKAVESAFANTRNAIIVCPRSRVANLVVRLGKVLADFGKCMDAIVSDGTTTRTTRS
ncbi:hypothetical protein C0J52_21579 [Blattella germanica]|nr:hypothetical protein C0J52_21579 [Blattella germanica]